MWKGTGGSTTTISDLTLAGQDIELLNAGSGTWTLAGNLKANAEETQVRAANGPINLTANLSGAGNLLLTNNTVTFGGTNSAFTGKTLVGDGRFSSLSIDSEARLGANPAVFTADQLTLNRGLLYNSGNVTIDDANRGIRIGASAGIFNVAPGTTVTVAVPISGTSSGSTLLTAPIYPNPVSGIFIKENSGTLALANPNNSHVGEIQINGGTLSLTGAGRFNNGDMPMPVVNNGTLLIDTTGNQTFGGVISGNGNFTKSNTGTTTLTAANTFTGALTINGGTVVAGSGGEIGRLGRGAVTVGAGATLRSDAADAFGYLTGAPSVINLNGGTLTAGGSGNFRTTLPNLSLTGGAITSLAGNNGDASGVWSFNAGSSITTSASATTSTIGSPKVGVQGALAINTALGAAATSDLTISAVLSNVSYGGDPGSITKSGTGRLTLSGANTYTGPTLVNAGTLTVTGSLANTATLGGTGSIAGATTINGTHTPGLSAGTQNFGSTLAYGAASRLKWELASNGVTAGTFDKVTASGAATITIGAKIDIILNASGSGVALNDAFWTQPRSWTFLTGSSVTGSFSIGTLSTDPGGRSVSNYGALSLQQNTTSATLVFTPYTPSETWRLTNFGGTSNAGSAADTEDPDKDGLNNLLEYALGSNPNDNAATASPQSSIAGNKLRIAFTRNTGASDINILVVAADDLGGPWTTIATSTLGAAFVPVAAGATVVETGGPPITAVQAEDIILIPDPEHPKRFLRVETHR